MKKKRLYAIALLAVLALLQIRIAFAGCAAMDAQAPSHSAVACAGEKPAAKDQHVMDAAEGLCAELCLQSSAAQQPEPQALLDVQLASFSPVASPVAWIAPPANAPRQLIAAAHPPHTRLIYLLQRLLI